MITCHLSPGEGWDAGTLVQRPHRHRPRARALCGASSSLDIAPGGVPAPGPAPPPPPRARPTLRAPQPLFCGAASTGPVRPAPSRSGPAPLTRGQQQQQRRRQSGGPQRPGHGAASPPAAAAPRRPGRRRGRAKRRRWRARAPLARAPVTHAPSRPIDAVDGPGAESCCGVWLRTCTASLAPFATRGTYREAGPAPFVQQISQLQRRKEVRISRGLLGHVV